MQRHVAAPEHYLEVDFKVFENGHATILEPTARLTALQAPPIDAVIDLPRFMVKPW
ncbi:hypothetical protein GCM10007885_27700 [Methylobacterium gnaphalii]|nr:hypothetical protein GCM10007885_27700 [Methylobacterium gnaphalii]